MSKRSRKDSGTSEVDPNQKIKELEEELRTANKKFNDLVDTSFLEMEQAEKVIEEMEEKMDKMVEHEQYNDAKEDAYHKGLKIKELETKLRESQKEHEAFLARSMGITLELGKLQGEVKAWENWSLQKFGTTDRTSVTERKYVEYYADKKSSMEAGLIASVTK